MILLSLFKSKITSTKLSFLPVAFYIKLIFHQEGISFPFYHNQLFVMLSEVNVSKTTHAHIWKKIKKMIFFVFVTPKCHRKEQHKTSKFLKFPGRDPEALTERGDPPLPTRSLHCTMWAVPNFGDTPYRLCLTPCFENLAVSLTCTWLYPNQMNNEICM